MARIKIDVGDIRDIISDQPDSMCKRLLENLELYFTVAYYVPKICNKCGFMQEDQNEYYNSVPVCKLFNKELSDCNGFIGPEPCQKCLDKRH